MEIKTEAISKSTQIQDTQNYIIDEKLLHPGSLRPWVTAE